MNQERRYRGKVFRTAVIGILAWICVLPILLTIAGSFLSMAEIRLTYGNVLTGLGEGFRADRITLKLIPDLVSLEQYKMILLRTPNYLMRFWNSCFLVIPIVVFQVGIASLSAYGFYHTESKWTKGLFFFYVVLMLMPYQVTLLPNYFVADWLGILDTNWAIWLPGFFSPFCVYLLTRYMKRVPYEIVEAARIDGAGLVCIYRRIMMPLCKACVTACVLLVFFDYWNMVEQPILLQKNPDYWPLSVFLSKVQSEDVGIAFAAAVIYMVPMILLFLYGEESLTEGMTIQGGVKG